MKKRLLSLLLAALMIVTMLPVTAMARDLTESGNINETDFEWNEETKTLTLTNYVNESMTDEPAIKLPDGSTIVLVGENKIKTSKSDGIVCNDGDGKGNLTIQGTGSLEISAGSNEKWTSGLHPVSMSRGP